MNADLVQAINDLAARITRLEKAAKAPERRGYKCSEVAAMFGLKDTKTVRDWIRDGRLEAVDMDGWWLIPAAAIDRLLATDDRLRRAS